MPRIAAILAAALTSVALAFVPPSTASADESTSVASSTAAPAHGASWFSIPDGRAVVVKDGVAQVHGQPMPLNTPVVGIASTPSRTGYWLVASDGGIFSFGDAAFFGSTGGMRLNKPVVGIASTPTGRGYWLVASDGGIFSFGDARFRGSAGAIQLNQPIVGIASTPTGRGYWLAAADGGIFTYGDAPYLGAALSWARTVGLANDGVGGYAVMRSDATTSAFHPRVARTAPAAHDDASPVQDDSSPAPRSAGQAVGVFTGPANYQPGGVNRFATTTGTSPKVAVDYMDMTGTWSDFTNVDWLLDPWAAWLKADASRTLVLSVPMLINSAKGDFDNTSYDQYHTQIAQEIASRGIASQVIIRLGWEMNGTWYPWSTSADGYKRMWRRLVPQYRAVSSALRFDWCSSGGAFDYTKSQDASRWYPGDDVVDIIGIDQYDIVWQHPGGDPSWRWSQIQPAMQWHADFAAAHGKPASVDEWALVNSNVTDLGGGGDNPLFVTNMAAWGADHGYAWLAYFNVKDGGPNTTLELNPKSLNAFRTSFG